MRCLRINTEKKYLFLKFNKTLSCWEKFFSRKDAKEQRRQGVFAGSALQLNVACYFSERSFSLTLRLCVKPSSLHINPARV
ncbi:MAG: hypothetical protein JWQ30_220 [Sediminibacterium sp.]|nr:hypothetical protein [Sediminibacterium sp.]